MRIALLALCLAACAAQPVPPTADGENRRTSSYTALINAMGDACEAAHPNDAPAAKRCLLESYQRFRATSRREPTGGGGVTCMREGDFVHCM